MVIVSPRETLSKRASGVLARLFACLSVVRGFFPGRSIDSCNLREFISEALRSLPPFNGIVVSFWRETTTFKN